MDHSFDDPGELLLHSVSEFNAWRREHPGEALDLVGYDLCGADLRDALLAGAQMDNCQLDDVDLRGAVLSGASLDGASLRRADLRGACFGHAALIEASLAASPLGAALVTGAKLRGASLVAARAQEAVFDECDLAGADLTDCELEGATLKRANLEGAIRTEPPPTVRDIEAVWARLRGEPLDVREAIFRAAFILFSVGDGNPEAHGFLSGIVHELGFTQADVDRLSPQGELVLDEVEMPAPASHWARRIVLVLLIAMIQTGEELHAEQLHVLIHFGTRLGFGGRALHRIIHEDLGVELVEREDA